MANRPSMSSPIEADPDPRCEVCVRPLADERMDDLLRFRRDVFGHELGWLASSDHAYESFRDAFDASAFQYVALDSAGRILGCVRLVPDSEIGLPIERHIRLGSCRPLLRPAEISRLAVSDRLRRQQLALLLMRAAYERARIEGFDFIVLDTYLEPTNPLLALYERLGFERLAEPYLDAAYAHPAPIVALGLDCVRAERELPERDPALHRRFRSMPEPRIAHA